MLENLKLVIESCGVAVHDNGENSLIIEVGDSRSPIPAVLTICNDELQVYCQITTVGEVGEDMIAELSIQALTLNTELAPFAVAMMGGEDDAENWPIVLYDTIPVVDLQPSEIIHVVESLNRALIRVAAIVDPVAV